MKRRVATVLALLIPSGCAAIDRSPPQGDRAATVPHESCRPLGRRDEQPPRCLPGRAGAPEGPPHASPAVAERPAAGRVVPIPVPTSTPPSAVEATALGLAATSPPAASPRPPEPTSAKAATLREPDKADAIPVTLAGIEPPTVPDLEPERAEPVASTTEATAGPPPSPALEPGIAEVPAPGAGSIPVPTSESVAIPAAAGPELAKDDPKAATGSVRVAPPEAESGPPRARGRAVAQVGEEVITLPTLTEAVKRRLQLLPADTPPKRKLIIKVARSTLESLIEQSLVMQEARRQFPEARLLEDALTRADRQWAEAELPRLLRAEGLASEADLRGKLARKAESLDDLRETYKLRALVGQMMRRGGGPDDLKGYIDQLRSRTPITSIMTPAQLAASQGDPSARAGMGGKVRE